MQHTDTPTLTEYRVRFVIDHNAEFEECNGENRPLTESEYAENHYNGKDGNPIPYTEYLRYYGNPDRHVYLMSEVERKCACCGVWSYVAGTGSIDMMDDDPCLRDVDEWFAESQINSLISGYLKTIAEEDISEAKHA